MLDMHNHILPGLDDGASDLVTSLEMVKIAVDHGTTAIVATPHVIEGEWLPTWEVVLGKCREVNQAAENAGLNIVLYPGGEVAVHLDLLGRLKGPGEYCINSGRYMLVELPVIEIPSYADKFFFTLQTRGITPILAHPERQYQIQRTPEILLEFINKGILVQVNAPSINGRMGKRVQQTAELLLKSNMVHLIGTDAHGVNSRRPQLDKAAQKITTLVGIERCRNLLYTNPKQVLYSREVEMPEVDHIVRTQKCAGILHFITKLWA